MRQGLRPEKGKCSSRAMEADLFTVLGNIAFIERQRERLHLVDDLGKACEIAESCSNGFLIYDNTGSNRVYRGD